MRVWAGVGGIAAAACACLALGGAASGAPAAAPSNDNFGSPTVLTGSSPSRTGDTNVGATLEVGENGATAGTDIPERLTGCCST